MPTPIIGRQQGARLTDWAATGRARHRAIAMTKMNFDMRIDVNLHDAFRVRRGNDAL
jgi:hypothetical protein